jgi:tRNA/rRNA methyltransferase
MSLDNFAFVLFKPKSPSNTGAAARALKNMGLRDLRIVARKGLDARDDLTDKGHPNSCVNIAKMMAVHGRDVLAAAAIHPSLDSALADCSLVVGTTARTGLYRSEVRTIREVSSELTALSEANRIALVFGPEDSGLTNEELKFCQRLVTIPTAPAYSSLNLAQAVMVVAYELMLGAGAARSVQPVQPLARSPEVNAMLERMTKALTALGFLPEENPDHIMFTIRAIFGRSGLRRRELDIFNGIASQILWFAEGGHETLAKKRDAGTKLR